MQLCAPSRCAGAGAGREHLRIAACCDVAGSLRRARRRPRRQGRASRQGGTCGQRKPAPGEAGTGGRKAQDRLELDATQITGNSELPRVLYVVPWKRSDLGDLTGRPVNSLLDEVLTPVDRDVFRRQNRYYEALRPDTASGGSGRAAP